MIQQFKNDKGEIDFKLIKLTALKKLAYSSAENWNEQTIDKIKEIVIAAENCNEEYFRQTDLSVITELSFSNY